MDYSLFLVLFLHTIRIDIRISRESPSRHCCIISQANKHIIGEESFENKNTTVQLLSVGIFLDHQIK